jgi:hypothetical protein
MITMTDKTDIKMISVPLWALEFIMAHADFVDDGPVGEGWKSDEMNRAIEALENAIKGGERGIYD